MTGKRAICLQVNQLNDPLTSYFYDWDATDADVEVCTPWGGSLGLSIAGYGGEVSLSGQSCYMRVLIQDASQSGPFRWAVHKRDTGEDTFNEFHWALAQIVPIVDNEIEAGLHLFGKFRFHDWPYIHVATLEWSKTFTKVLVDGDSALAVIVGDTSGLLLGAEKYSLAEIETILANSDADQGTKLATYVIGARLHGLLDGAFAPSNLTAALEEADSLLAAYPGKLPWAPGTIDPADETLMASARDALMEFVSIPTET